MGFNSDQQPLCQKGGDGAISPAEERERKRKERRELWIWHIKWRPSLACGCVELEAYSRDPWMHIASRPWPYPHLSSSQSVHHPHGHLSLVITLFSLLFHSLSTAFLSPSSFYAVMLTGIESLDSWNQNKLSWIIRCRNKWNVTHWLVGSTPIKTRGYRSVLKPNIHLMLCL